MTERTRGGQEQHGVPMEPLDVETIRKVWSYIKDGGAPAFTSSRYTQNIDPFWFSTPIRRGILWEAIARLVKLDPGYGSTRPDVQEE